MISIDFSLTLVVGGFDSEDELRAELGRVMDELINLQESGCGIEDPAMSLDMSGPLLTIELVAEGSDFTEAQHRADSCARAAIHAAGGATPHWHYEIQESSSHRTAVHADA